jgi:hypothetical protein
MKHTCQTLRYVQEAEAVYREVIHPSDVLPQNNFLILRDMSNSQYIYKFFSVSSLYCSSYIAILMPSDKHISFFLR